jgi:hypothetical protein
MWILISGLRVGLAQGLQKVTYQSSLREYCLYSTSSGLKYDTL